MASNPLLFKDAEEARDAILASQRWKLSALYYKWSQEIGEQAKRLSHQSTPSAQLQARQLKELKKMFLSSTKTKLAAAMVKSDMADMKKLLDPSEIGGTPFLGISKPVIKAHGSSDARAICNAVLRAKEYAESGFIADVEANIDAMKLERGAEKV